MANLNTPVETSCITVILQMHDAKRANFKNEDNQFTISFIYYKAPKIKKVGI